MTVEVEGIGSLTNRVAAPETPTEGESRA
jgi:hypothetical protein